MPYQCREALLRFYVGSQEGLRYSFRRHSLYLTMMNVILFILTFITTFSVEFVPTFSTTGNLWRAAANGLWYSCSIMTILLAHEMGHFLMCKRYGVKATLPYFLPFPPPNPFGTLGAVIKMDQRIPHRRALFDIGAAGPLAGLFFTIPSIILGLHFSKILDISVAKDGAYISLGEPLVFSFMAYVVKGPLASGQDIVLHPLAFAGWAGLFVTALNLLPVGQLDGGHVVYALFGERSKFIYKVGFFFLATVTLLLYPYFFLFLFLLFVFAFVHPPTANDALDLNTWRKVLGVTMIVVFGLCFTPQPFQFGLSWFEKLVQRLS